MTDKNTQTLLLTDKEYCLIQQAQKIHDLDTNETANKLFSDELAKRTNKIKRKLNVVLFRRKDLA